MLHRLLALTCLLAAACSQAANDLAPAQTQTGAAPDGTKADGSASNGSVHSIAPGALDRLTAAERETKLARELGLDFDERVDYSDVPLAQLALVANSPAPRYRYRSIDGYEGLYEFAIFNTGSGWEERFLLQTPRVAPTSPVPLVVVFHKYSATHADLLVSGFIPEVQKRGWFAICPIGAHKKNFGNLESQINIRAALSLVRSLFPIDASRIYGVGFSMGGGSVANYAARHLNPRDVMFAAICDHTGGVSLAHTWWSDYDDNDQDDNLPNVGDNLESPDVLENLYGGTPVQHPFAYQRCSSIDLDPFTGTIGPDTDFARNLSHIPVLVWRALNEPSAFLVTETDTFNGHIQSQNAGNQYQTAPSAVHAWATLDAGYVCTWFATKSLVLPTSGTTLADEDGQWFSFQVEQSAPGTFTPFTWSVDAPNKRVSISATKNLKRLRISPAAYGLVMSGAVELNLSTADGTGDEFQFLYTAHAPISVLRDGVPASGTYDALGQTFLVTETSSTPHQWILTFP